MKQSRGLRFFFDIISHNAYLAWTQIHHLAERHDVTVEPVPVLFAGLLAANRQLGPAEIRDKAVWMLKDVARKALRLNIPLAPPAGHPFNPLLALRACSIDLAGDRRRLLIDGLFRAAWAESRDVSRPEVVEAVATEAGLDGPAVVERASTAVIKARLRAVTEHAISTGVFGVPSMVVGGELFWGFDDFTHLELFLAGEDPVAGQDLEPWLSLRPLAWRREAPNRDR